MEVPARKIFPLTSPLEVSANRDNLVSLNEGKPQHAGGAGKQRQLGLFERFKATRRRCRRTEIT